MAKKILIVTDDAGESYEILYAYHRFLEEGYVPKIAAALQATTPGPKRLHTLRRLQDILYTEMTPAVGGSIVWADGVVIAKAAAGEGQGGDDADRACSDDGYFRIKGLDSGENGLPFDHRGPATRSAYYSGGPTR